jgi:hypothetical protein
MRQGWGFRGWAIVWAVLQFALPAAVTIGDARLERESAGGSRTHVESASSVACRPAHAADCALCQLVSHAAAPAHSSAASTIVAAVCAPLPSTASSRASAGPARPSLARAPPRA